MGVRAMFKCESKLEKPEGFEVELSAVCAQDGDEAADFFKWTPYGEFKMGLVQPEVAQQFVVGQLYYLDFNPVPED